MRTYYTQRAGAGLIITEGSQISQQGVGYPATPGIHTDAQVTGWKDITDSVHQRGGHIFCQLWHCGRVSHPSFQEGEPPVAPSAVRPEGQAFTYEGLKDFVTPRALDLEAIPGLVADYAHAADRALRAGFDGVEIHAANGYLIDQFLQASSNLRTDRYGGSITNRARFLLEVTDAVLEVWGPGQVGMHLAPRGGEDPDHDPTGEQIFGHVAAELGKRGIAFICAREAQSTEWLGPRLKQKFGGVYIANQEFTGESAEAVVAQGLVDGVAFGRSFIANPDLPRRLAEDLALNEPDPATFYGDGPEGYTDYPRAD